MGKKTVKASDLFIQALEAEGVEYIFGVPGEENLDFLESLRQSKTIKLILTRHEQGAAFMAATYGRLTGKTGVCLATLGPGATNFVTGAAYATLGAMPMMMISGQKPVKKSKQGQFQIVDIVNMMRPITKYTHQIVNANNIPAKLREAFRIAEEERPGGVHIELPEDIAHEEADGDNVVFTPSRKRRPIADQPSIDEAVAMIKQSKMPLLLVGAGANRKRISDSLHNFVDRTAMFFFVTQMGKGVIDERHRKYLGTAALSDNDYLHSAIEKADLIINVGHDVVEKPPFFMEHGGKKVIHINFNSAVVDDVYFPQLEVIGDIASSIERITEALGDCDMGDDYFGRVRDEVLSHIDEGADDSRFPMIPQRLVADVRKVMGDEDIIALDNGIYKIWFARNYNACQPNTVLLDNALATMGAGLPSAMMAAMLYPKRRIMSIVGDGGFMMNSQEIETAIRLGLNLVVLILNDSSYGMIRWKQAGNGFADWGLEFGNPDFVKYAEAYGAVGHRIESADGLVRVCDEAFSRGGVHIVDLPMDYSENKKVLIDELAQRAKID